MTTLVLALLVPPQALLSTGAPVYTCPIQQTARISRAVFTNTSGSAVTVTAGIASSLALLPSSAYMISSYSIPAGATYISPELVGAVVPAGYSLFAYAATPSVVILTVSGLTLA